MLFRVRLRAYLLVRLLEVDHRLLQQEGWGLARADDEDFQVLVVLALLGEPGHEGELGVCVAFAGELAIGADDLAGVGVVGGA